MLFDKLKVKGYYIRFGVYIVDNVIGIDVAERRGAASVPCDVDGMGGVFSRVEHVELVTVGVSVELTTDSVVKTFNNTTEFPLADAEGRSRRAVWNVSKDVNLLVVLFGLQQDIMQPLHLI